MQSFSQQVLRFCSSPLLQGSMPSRSPLTDLQRESGSVVHGSVVATEYRMDPEDGLIYTDTTVEVKRNLLGRGTDARVVIRIPEEGIGGLGLKVSDTPYFDMGEEVIAFLNPEPSSAYRVHGWFQGKMDVKEGRVTDFDLLGDQYQNEYIDHTMYGYVDYGWCRQRTLHQCDIDGIVKIYGSCGF